MLRRFASIFLSSLLCAAFSAANIAALFGVVTAENVVLRKGPSTSAAKLTLLQKDARVTILSDNGQWIQVSAGDKTGWVRGDFIQKDEETAVDAAFDSDSLRLGSEGDEVERLQNQLIYLGYLDTRADGSFGTATEQAVLQYQKRNNMEQDGVAGPATRQRLAHEAQTIQGIIETAKKYQGVPYVRGGFSTNGFDCTGFTKYVFKEAANINLDRTTTGQAAQGVEVPYAQIRSGDLVCFYAPVGHVGLYIGGGKYIHSPRTGEVVKIATLKTKNLTHIRRIVGVLAREG